ncbi:hypothetical protein HMPREF1983_00298 [Gemella bergeri ATCC 700627]|uniref:Uncharacterized protein n=1 Tax=Gemella bergeri ATCC 700627 TaxID=1321820 RepID=U2SBR1_9BACL|nr:hypothetical protein [Gemella bergeri]ERK60197.1 hypothetical protein HMPREF1983_00298 [Gemella bergeri ATCC 700627]
MTRFLKIFMTLTIITAIGLGIFYYINNSSKDNNSVDDKTNIETTVKNETNSQEDVEGTVVAKRSTENN